MDSFASDRQGRGTTIDFELLFRSAPGLYLVLDRDLRILTASDAYVTATMTDRAEIIGKGLFEVFPDNPDDPAADGVRNLKASLDRVLARGTPDTMAVQKYDVRRRDGAFEVRYWSPLNTPVFDADHKVCYIIHRVEDVTDFVELEQRESESSLRASEMEREVVRRSKELQETNRQLRAADEAKSEFLSRMSHELRTPLNAIIGFGQLLQMDGLGAEHDEWVDTIMAAARHLQGLMDDVLDISRIERGNLSISVEATSFTDVVDEVLEFIRPQASARSLSMRTDIDREAGRYVLADRQRLRQVLINLLSNAVKYNNDNGEITVDVTSTDTGAVRFAVCDTGPGIDERALEKLFVPFERLDAQQRGIEGTGLGLVVSRQLVEAMGGSLSVTSEVGKGTTFFVELQAVEPDVAHELQHESVPREIRIYDEPKTVFYVEDVYANIRLVEGIVKQRPSISLVSIMLGEVVVDMVKEQQPNLILLDLHLPDIDGDEVLRRLKLDEETRHIPVVMVSADATQRHADRLIAAGAWAYLTKPIAVRKLLDALDRTLVPDRQPDASHS